MKATLLTLIIAMSFSSSSYASCVPDENEVVIGRLVCRATSFRASQDEKERNSALIYLKIVIDSSEDIYLTDILGHVSVAGYYGVFWGDDLLAEAPYQKAAKYKNHLRFKNFNAIRTAGYESGMWGDFIINQNIVGGMEPGDTIDAHYVFKAGDHIGGTIDFSCSEVL